MFVPPFMLARQIMSLHWRSHGRAGWNIVTALDGHENFGLPAMPSSEERYARAAEYTEVVRLLWQSFPEESLKRNRESECYADPSQIRSLNHTGSQFSVKGPLNLPAFGRAPIPLVQAGASEVGRNFASSIADAIFAATPDVEAATDLRRDLRQRAEGHGRRADDIRLLPGLSLYLAPTRKEAEELFAFTHARGDRNRKIVHILKLPGLDLADWPEDRRITAADLPSDLPAGASKTHAELLRRVIVREEPLLPDLLGRPEVIGSGHWQIVGTVDDAVQEISAWADAGAIDGFITTRADRPAQWHLPWKHSCRG